MSGVVSCLTTATPLLGLPLWQSSHRPSSVLVYQQVHMPFVVVVCVSVVRTDSFSFFLYCCCRAQGADCTTSVQTPCPE